MTRNSLTRGALSGASGGVAGLVAMHLASRAAERLFAPRHERHAGGRDSISLFGEHHEPGESPEHAAGRLFLEKTPGLAAGPRRERLAATAVHWSYGMGLAAAYGMARGRERRPHADVAGGLAWGLGLWGIEYELLTPLAGFAAAPASVPFWLHARALASRLAYAVAAAATVQVLHRGVRLRRRSRRSRWRRVAGRLVR